MNYELICFFIYSIFLISHSHCLDQFQKIFFFHYWLNLQLNIFLNISNWELTLLNIMVSIRCSIPPWSLGQCSSRWFQTRGGLHVKLAASSIIETLEIAKGKRELILIFFIRISHIQVINCIFKRTLKYLEVAKARHIFFFVCVILRFMILMALCFWISHLVVYYINDRKTCFTWLILRLLLFLLFYWRLHFELYIWKFKFE